MKEVVYLDYAATVPLLAEAQAAMREAEGQYYANASALHTPGHLARNEIEECRALLAEIIGAEPNEIIFTSGASEGNNTVMHVFEGCEIETSPLEHHSVLEAVRVYRGGTEVNMSGISVNRGGMSADRGEVGADRSGAGIDGGGLASTRGARVPKLYSFMLANNETGEILEWPEVQASACAASDNPRLFGVRDRWGRELTTDKRSAYRHSDLTQVLGKLPIDVKELGLDYATLSAHKIGGPIGVGALYVRRGVPYRPLIIGGLQEEGRRGGTYNTVGIVGFKAALEVMRRRRTWEIYDTGVRKLRDKLARRILAEVPGASLNTDIAPGRSLPNIVNASFAGAEGESIQLYLDAEGVVVATGSACAAGDTQPSHVLMAKTGDAEAAHSSVRFSLGLETTEAEVEKVMAVLPGIVRRLQGMSTRGFAA